MKNEIKMIQHQWKRKKRKSHKEVTICTKGNEDADQSCEESW